jgi:hypothetical protein
MNHCGNGIEAMALRQWSIEAKKRLPMAGSSPQYFILNI